MTLERPGSSLSLLVSKTPFDIWAGPDAVAKLLPELRPRFESVVTIADITGLVEADLLDGPAVLLLTSDDLRSASRDDLMALAEKALPGRPVIWGGSRDRDTLLDAINNWRAYRLVPRRSSMEILVDAMRKSYEAYAIEMGLDADVTALHEECALLDAALADLTRAQERLLHVERLAMVGRFSRTLQQRLGGFYKGIEELRRGRDTLQERGSLLGLLDDAVDASLGVKTLLDDMAALTENRQEKLDFERGDLDEMIERSCKLLERHPDLRYREFQTNFDSGAMVCVDRHRLFHALMNLVRNAIQATEAGGTITLVTSRQGEEAWIEVRDDGCGMSEEIKAKIFRPFFTTKGSEGMGLGLRMTRSAITRQGGTLECESAPGEGTCFRVVLPVVEDSSSEMETKK